MMPSPNALALRALLLDSAQTPTSHRRLRHLYVRIRHAPLYEVPFTTQQLQDESGLSFEAYRAEMVAWLADNYVTPGDGAVLLALPGNLYAVTDVGKKQLLGITGRRNIACVLAQDRGGDTWSKPFNDQTLFGIMCAVVSGPDRGEPASHFRAGMPLVIRVEPKNRMMVMLDPDDPQDRADHARKGSNILDAISNTQVVLFLLGHLLRSGTLDDFRVTPPPLPETH
jgi:hypothetical protein